jgi:hypothetical protein
MKVSMETENGAKVARWVGRGAARRSPARRLWLLLALGCFTQKPSSETAPPAPEAPAIHERVLTPPAATSAESLERKSGAPEKDAAQRSAATGAAAAGAAAPPAASAPLAPQKKPAAKARGLAEPEAQRDRSDRAVGGADERPPSDQLRRRLDRAYRAGSPDCPSARDRKKAVCDLAAQICQLIDRDPNVAAVAEYCADAKERCAEAQRRTEERCPE